MRCIEAGAGLLGIQIPVTHDKGVREELLQLTEQRQERGFLRQVREELLQLTEQRQERGFLRQGARVLRTTLGIQTALVTDADAVAVVVQVLQLTEQRQERGFLRQGARVLRTTLGIQTALVTDADAVAVVVQAVGTHGFQPSPAVNHAVARQVVVVPSRVR